MNKLVLFILITFVVVASGCVQGQVGSTGPDLDDAHQAASAADLCENVTCTDSKLACGDGYEATCPNTCNEGECTACTPGCSGHESSDPCYGIICPDTSLECSDGTVKTCGNTCSDGECTYCQPDCPDFDCNESWTCTSWTDCSGGTQTRTCTDDNDCGTVDDRPSESQSCSTDHIIFSEIYYDVDGDDNYGEWVELYNSGSNINMSGWTITDNTKTFTIPEIGIVQAGSYIMFARDNDTMWNDWSCSGAIVMTLGLNNAGDYLILKDPDGSEVDFVAWEDGGTDDPYPAWDLKAVAGEVITRKDIDDPDTDSVSDWEVEDSLDPDC